MNPPSRSPASVPHLRLVPGGGEAASADGLATAYKRLAEVVQELVSEQAPGALRGRIAETIAALVPYQALHLYEADDGARRLRATLVRSEYRREVLRHPVPFGEGITGWAVEHRRPVLANRAHLDPRARLIPGTPTEAEALIVVPLSARGRVLGALNLYRTGEDAAFSELELALAARFGDAAALALDNARIRAELEHLARTDPLTGLLNRRAFDELLREELAAAAAGRCAVGLVMIDVDDFKRVNDAFGHVTGDEVLAALAAALQSVVRRRDAVCRIGGEEFAVVLPGAELETARPLAERIAARAGELELGAAGPIEVSVGIAIGPRQGASPPQLVASAEAAMMTAKARGKGRVVVFGDGPAERPGVRPRGRGGRSRRASVPPWPD